jgi:hypothetical protein
MSSSSVPKIDTYYFNEASVQQNVYSTKYVGPIGVDNTLKISHNSYTIYGDNDKTATKSLSINSDNNAADPFNHGINCICTMYGTISYVYSFSKATKYVAKVVSATEQYTDILLNNQLIVEYDASNPAFTKVTISY